MLFKHCRFIWKKCMKTIVVIDYPFPYGGAETNRIISYTKELSDLGHDITMHCLQPVELSDYNKHPIPYCGFFEGLQYIYTSKTACWPEHGKQKWKKIFLWFMSYINSLLLIVKNAKDVDCVLIYSADYKKYFFYYFVSRLCNIVLLLERSEFPIIFYQKDRYNQNILLKLKKKIIEKSYKLFDGWILETQNLVDYYKNYANKKSKFCIVPMTVEVERFADIEISPNLYGDYIAYCGNLKDIDGVSILIKAFAIIANKYSSLKLVLAGNSDEMCKHKTLVKKLDIESKVIFLGRIDRDMVPSFLANAKILALASPTSERSCATMPCKVGEYLCTGVPSVITGLGEIHKYIKDNESAFLAEPDSEFKFAEKIDFVLSDYTNALRVAQKGKEIAKHSFSGKTQAKIVDSFLKSNFI